MAAAPPTANCVPGKSAVAGFFAKSLSRSVTLFCILFTLVIVSCAVSNYALLSEEKSAALDKRAKEANGTRIAIEIGEIKSKLEVETAKIEQLMAKGEYSHDEFEHKGSREGVETYINEFVTQVDAAKRISETTLDRQLAVAFTSLEKEILELYEVYLDIADGNGARQEVAAVEGINARVASIRSQIQQDFDRVTSALESTRRRFADQITAANARIDTLRNLAMNVAIVSVVFLTSICAFSIFIVRKYLIQPLSCITLAFNKLIAGDTSYEVHETSRADEIGDLARAYTGFRRTTLERYRLARESRLLAEFNEWLQCCKSLDELYEMVGTFLTVLLPNCAGSLYVYANSRDALDCAKVWNGAALTNAIQPDDCWSLRKGRAFTHGKNEIEFHCLHVDPSQAKDHCCIPISAHGETIGMLHLELRFDKWVSGLTTGGEAFADQLRLGGVCAEHISMAIANVKLRDQLRDQTIRDSLTGLFNRRYVMDTLRRETSRARRLGQPVSLLSLDVDHFKQFNDNHGHDAGDMVLRAVGECLEKGVRNEDIACRYGGEEFIVVLPNVSPAAALRKAEEIRGRVEAIVVRYLDRNLPRISVSIGVAAFPNSGNHPEAIIRAADEALYAAKENGRNRVEAARSLDIETLDAQGLHRILEANFGANQEGLNSESPKHSVTSVRSAKKNEGHASL